MRTESCLAADMVHQGRDWGGDEGMPDEKVHAVEEARG